MYAEYVEHTLKFFNESIQVYCSHKYTRLNFQKYIDECRALDKITKELTQNQSCLIIIGKYITIVIPLIFIYLLDLVYIIIFTLPNY